MKDNKGRLELTLFWALYLVGGYLGGLWGSTWPHRYLGICTGAFIGMFFGALLAFALLLGLEEIGSKETTKR